MEAITHLLDKLTLHVQTGYNFVVQNRLSDYKPNIPYVDHERIDRHHKAIRHAFDRYLYSHETHAIINDYRRSSITEEIIYNDFFNGDIPYKPCIKDSHYDKALQYTTLKWAPPVKYRPVHLLDVQHHYPLNNHANAEAPFSTDPMYIDMLTDPTLRRSVGNMKPIIFNHCRRFHHEIKNAVPNAQSRHLYFMILHTKSALVKLRSLRYY
jgi:hypothetical protein